MLLFCVFYLCLFIFFFFFFNDTATTEIYTLSLHDALPIFNDRANHRMLLRELEETLPLAARHGVPNVIAMFGNRRGDRKSTRLNSSHGYISYAVFCLKKKKKD